ncbi:hypothetical protein FHS90_001375 [Rufibacter quisquiliarum]|uniref:Uncharacterized protein n=1 Tax=Rufibacter quisquiliarum TaxID=1549639 RepID=A0A839GIU0_9BACT|nr:hypothetical protein [Rufibacter quisquiliarum]
MGQENRGDRSHLRFSFYVNTKAGLGFCCSCGGVWSRACLSDRFGATFLKTGQKQKTQRRRQTLAPEFRNIQNSFISFKDANKL